MFGRAKRVAFKGGRKKFVADRVEIGTQPKIVWKLFETRPNEARIVDIQAKGRHGHAFDLLVQKGTQERKLVVKKYRLEAYPKLATQSRIAAKEFRLFQKLKEKGFHVPPTIRLVKIGGKKYVAMTDLSKFGNQLASAPQTAKGRVSGKEIEKAYLIRMQETKRAKEELGIDIIDSWEFAIDTKNGKISPFILDLGFSSGGK